MRQERALEPADEANLVLDHAGQVNVFLVAGLLAPGGFVSPAGELDMAALRAVVGRRVGELAPLRQVPVRAGRRHVWRDREPDLGLHVRRVESIAGRDDLERLCGELMTEPLPLTRPLWELLVAPTPRGAGMVLRIHHALADGVAAADLIRRMLGDPQTRAAATAPTPTTPPRARPRDRVVRAVVGVQRTLTTLAARGLPETLLLGARSARHGVVFADADLDRIRATAHRADATVNDAVLAVAAAGYRAALGQSGGPMLRELPVSVPVALTRHGDSRNQVGIMMIRLPMDDAPPHDIIARIADQTRAQKLDARRQGTLELMRGPVGARVMDRIAHRQHLVGGFVTDVPGPEHELVLAGAPLTQLWPVAVLAANVRLGMAAVSYAGRLCIGVHFDAGYIDGAVVAPAVRRRLAALESTAR